MMGQFQNPAHGDLRVGHIIYMELLLKQLQNDNFILPYFIRETKQPFKCTASKKRRSPVPRIGSRVVPASEIRSAVVYQLYQQRGEA